MKVKSYVIALLMLGLMTVGAGLQAKSKGTLTGQININEASVTQLTMLPGIGIKTAEAIQTYAKSHGFKSAGELEKVKGIGPKSLVKLTPYVVLSGATTAKFERAQTVKK